MARTASTKTKPWERLLMLLVNGGSFSKQQILDKIDYPYEYRLSTLIYDVKVNGGIIKTHKDGRKVAGYELVNIEDMTKLLSKRNLSAMKLDKVETLSDLGAEQIDGVLETEEIETVE